MKLQKIISQRNYNSAAPFKIVYEWENIISDKGNINLYKETSFHFHKIYGWLKKIGLVDFYKSIISSKELSLFFVMRADVFKEPWLNKSTIPVIIDFWLNDSELPSFYEAYKDCPLVLITSAEVVEYLKTKNCPLKIEHWPLSIPDYMKPDRKENYEKLYDLCFLGRPSPYFVDMLKQYEITHPDFKYILGSRSSKNREYIDNHGNFIAKDSGRESYIHMIRSSKITCYSTPGLDSNKSETSIFNQVTPRLFEMLAGGCYVLAHNIFVELGFQFGIIGIFLCLILIIFFIRAFIKTYKMKHTYPELCMFFLMVSSFSIGQLLFSDSYLTTLSFGLLCGIIKLVDCYWKKYKFKIAME